MRPDQLDCGWRKWTRVEIKYRAASGRQVLQPWFFVCLFVCFVFFNSAEGTTSDTDDVVKQKHLSTCTYIMKRDRSYISAKESFIADGAITEKESGSAFLTRPCQHF